MLSLDHEFLQAVIAKRKRKEERKRLKEAAAARGQHPETSQESVVGRTTSAPEIVMLPAVQRLPESQTANHLAPNPPAIRKKTKKPNKDRRPAVEPSRAVEVPVVQAVGPEIIEILDTDDEEDLRATTRALPPLPITPTPVSPSTVPIVASSSKKKKKVSSSTGKSSAALQISSMNTTAIASSSSREKTPILQTSSPNSITAHTSPPSQKKKVSSSKEKTEKAEKAARKQARAERRARKAERRAKRAGKDKNNAAAVAGGSVVPVQSGEAGRVSSARESAKKDKQKKTLRAAWAAGGRKEVPIEIDEEEHGRSVSPLQTMSRQDRKEQEAEARFRLMMLEVGNAAHPVVASADLQEESWKTEMRSTKTLSNQELRNQGGYRWQSLATFTQSLPSIGIKIRKDRLSDTEKAIMLGEVEKFRKVRLREQSGMKRIALRRGWIHRHAGLVMWTCNLVCQRPGEAP